MISATDSFIKYLSTELAGTPPVHWVRVTSSDAASGELQMDALNVTILAADESGSIEEILVSLDLVGSDERTVMTWAKLVREVLLARQYTPEFVYEPDPSSPTATGRLVEWRGNDCGFRVASASQRYFHMNATLPIRHSRW